MSVKSRSVLSMAISTVLFCTTSSASTPSAVPPWSNRALSADARASLVEKELTQDEKFQLIRSYFGDKTNGATPPTAALGSAGYVPAIPRLGIPAIQETDAGLGVTRPGASGTGATALPAGLATAASWDPDLAYDGGAMIGQQARRKGFSVLLAGGINLVRDPRNGRNFEYAGEDPLLAGVMVGHTIRGVQDQKIISTIKHYALNALESGRMTISADLNEQAMREADLLAFEIAIGIGDPGSVMCAYNRINGVYACENDFLMNKVLKGDWGYKGYVMSDWGAVHSAAPAVMAGLDQESAGEVFDAQVFFDKPLRAAVSAGQVPQSRLDDMVHRILRTMFAKGIIDDPVKPAKIDYDADGLVSRRLAEAGAVLLRNQDEILPLSRKLKSIAVIGAHADVGVLTGGGSSSVTSPSGNPVPGLSPQEWPGPVRYQPSSPLKAIQALSGGRVQYADGTDVVAAAKLAGGADVAIVFAQQWAAESFDRPDMLLPDNQDALIAAIAKANPHTVVVLENNGPVHMPWLGDVGAVLESWYPGARGGEAIARLLFGEVAPSGRLPLTWPKDESQLPHPAIAGAGLPPNGQPAEKVDYNIEGADVGYRWFEKKKLEPLFPFGYGLTYTRFAYSQPKAHVGKDGKLTIAFEVRNVGLRDGTDVPQVYVNLPDATQPRRLIGWSRLTLGAGQSKHVEVVADPRLLARFDTTRNGWHVAAGNYSIHLGHSATALDGETGVSLPESFPGSP
jgi:beta-glucosidase